MKIFITGIAGFVGSHLAERLLADGNQVSGIDSFDPYYSPLLKTLTAKKLKEKGAEIITGDLASDDLAPYLEGKEAIFHLAAQPGNSPRTPFARYQRNNLEATANLLGVAEKLSSLKAFINVSTSSVYGFVATGDENTPAAPVSNYGVTKLAAEQLVLSRARDKNFPGCSLRLFSVYGERERPDKVFPKLLTALYEDSEFPLFEGSLEHTRTFTYVGDAVEGFVSALKNFEQARGEIFNIGGGAKTSTGEALAIVEDLYGKKAKRRLLPRRAGDQTETFADVRKAAKLLGYAPRVSPQEGLSRVVKWFKSEIEGKVEYK